MTTQSQSAHWDQSKFDATFISTHEICEELKVERCTVLVAKRSGKLPQPISFANCDIWIRNEVRPILDDWKVSLNKRRRIGQ